MTKLLADLTSLARRIWPAILTRYFIALGLLWVRLPLRLRAEPKRPQAKQIVVSLTSFPPRIEAVHLTLRSLLKQSIVLDRIVLVLSGAEFPKGETGLPSNLLRVISVAKGRIEVLFTEGNMRSFKKLLPTLELFPQATIITVDDDVLYRKSWAATLVHASESFPGRIIGTRGTMIRLEGSGASPYVSWRPAPNLAPGHSVFLTGRGGILYPPHSLHAEVSNWALASKFCPSGDDIWFKAMAALHKTQCLTVEAGREYPSNGASQTVGLWTTNVDGNENDAAFKRVVDYFHLWSTFQN